MGTLERFRRALGPLGALAGLSGAAALVNRSLRDAGPLPVDHIGGLRRPWVWRTYDIFVTELAAQRPLERALPIMLVHGIYAGASSFEFRKLAPLLARTHRVVALDLLGCGLSEMPDLAYTPELFIEQIVDALGEFFDGPMMLVGSSLGAAFAIRAAVRAPDRVRALGAIAPTGLAGVLDGDAKAAQRVVGSIFRSPLAGESAWNALAARPTLRWFLENQSYADSSSVTPEVLDAYYALTHQPGARFVPSYFVGGGLNVDVARDLPFVDAPLLVLWGEAASKTNPATNAREYARLAPVADVAIFPNAGLLPHEETPDATAAAIERFLVNVVSGEETSERDRNAPQMASRSVPDIFKSYDIRGIYPEELTDDLAYDSGR
ncbi:MAG: alpha/beta fold hydrolase, partial [Candidatus Eremiobacteraeota bacterium]|nr:alpha/beta fold hydrolase [Candidatus Eremiobacteraeota bacterium]